MATKKTPKLRKGESVYAGVVYPTTNRDEVFRLRYAAGLVAIAPIEKPNVNLVRSLKNAGFRNEEIAAAISAGTGTKTSSNTVKSYFGKRGPVYSGRGTKAIGTGALKARAAA